MKSSTVSHAVARFGEMKEELAPLIAEVGLPALTCLVRQHYMDVDRGWSFYDVGLDEVKLPGMSNESRSWAFWGRLVETRAGKDKRVMVIMDPDSIDSIEFEVYDPEDSGQGD